MSLMCGLEFAIQILSIALMIDEHRVRFKLEF